MPDRRAHRGPHPEDLRLFAPEFHAVLRQATADLSWLLSRGYPSESSLKLVGDRYTLVARQRIAVGRCACSDADVALRFSRQVQAPACSGQPLHLDGYNVLTTIEAALAGGVLLLGRDGTFRDMASMHGSYRKVAESVPALELIGQTTAACGVAECVWYLDRPVSNSGRLKTLMQAVGAAHGWSWQIELVPNPDEVLSGAKGVRTGFREAPEESQPADSGGPICDAKNSSDPFSAPPPSIIVATADSAILDGCRRWFNLARETVVRHVPQANVVDLGM